VLPFLDGSASAPVKYARAIIFEGGKQVPDSQEYMIGPLPVTNSTTIEKLDYIYNGGYGGSVPYNARYFDGPRTSATDPLIASIMSNISDITAALFQGRAYYGSRDNRSMCMGQLKVLMCYRKSLTTSSYTYTHIRHASVIQRIASFPQHHVPDSWTSKLHDATGLLPSH
jgi:hypothetical protein